MTLLALNLKNMKKNFFKNLIVGLSIAALFTAVATYADRTFTLPDQTGNAGRFLQTDGVNPAWGSGGAGSGTVTSFIFSNGSGFIGTVTNATTTPTLALKTSLTQNSIPFIGAVGALVENTTNLIWNDVNKSLGVGIKFPASTNLAELSPLLYNTGTASQTTTVITGVGTTFTDDMVGKTFIFADGTTRRVTAFTNTTTLTVTPTGTVGSQAFEIHYPGLSVSQTGNVGVGVQVPGAQFNSSATGTTVATTRAGLFSNAKTSGTNNLQKRGLEITSSGTLTGTGTTNTGLLVTGVSGATTNIDAAFSGGQFNATLVGATSNAVGSAAGKLYVFASGAVTTAGTGATIQNTTTSSTASIGKVGLRIDSTGTWNGASATNTGLVVNAPTGGTANYAAVLQGNVGLQNTAPTELLTLGTPAAIRGVMSFSGSTSGKVILQAAAIAGTPTLTLPTTVGTSGQVLTTDGTGILSFTTPSSGLSLTTIGAAPNANGATLTGSVLNLEPASASFGGVVTTTTQSFAGTKTFTGLVGLGGSPTEELDVTGNVKFSGALMPNNLPGTSGYLLTSAGAGASPTWSNPAAITGLAMPINNLLAATGTNGINNGNFFQNWVWNSLADGAINMSAVTTASNDGSYVAQFGRSGANAASTITTYAALFSDIHTGTSSTNVAIKAQASGGTNNYAIIVPNGGGRVGINNSTPGQMLSLGTAGSSLGTLGFNGSTSGTLTVKPDVATATYSLTLPPNTGSVGQVLVTDGTGITTFTNTPTVLVPLSSITAATANNHTILNGNNAQIWNWDTLSGNLGMVFKTTSTALSGGSQLVKIDAAGSYGSASQTGYGLLVSNTATGSSSKNIGIQTSASGGTFNYALITNGGNVGIGQVSPTAQLHIGGGSVVAGSAPLKIDGNSVMTTPEAGAIENDGTNLFYTPSTKRQTVFSGWRGFATLDFPSTAAGTSSDLTITVTNALDGDICSVGVPNGSTVANGTFTCWVSSANTATVRFSNNNLVTALDPASGTFKVAVQP